MTKIGTIITGRYQSCGSGKCFGALRRRTGAIAIHSAEEVVKIVGCSTCGAVRGAMSNTYPRR